MSSPAVCEKYSTDMRLQPHLRQMSAMQEKMSKPFPPELPAFLQHVNHVDGMISKASAMFQIPVEAVETQRHEIPSLNGDAKLELFVHKPTNVAGPLPCLYSIHGGGMVLMSAKASEWHHQYLASLGLVVAAIEFRNVRENTPYPTQLDDCEAGLRWVHQHKSELGISKVVLHGESGGGTLCLALPLRLKKKQQLDWISGTVGVVPWVGPSKEDVPSVREFLSCNNGLDNLEKHVQAMLKVPENEMFEQWPILATKEQLQGYPKTLIVTCEMDVLRDGGIAFARALAEAGVSVVSLTINGCLHQSCVFGKMDKDNYTQMCDLAASFARRC